MHIGRSTLLLQLSTSMLPFVSCVSVCRANSGLQRQFSSSLQSQKTLQMPTRQKSRCCASISEALVSVCCVRSCWRGGFLGGGSSRVVERGCAMLYPYHSSCWELMSHTSASVQFLRTGGCTVRSEAMSLKHLISIEFLPLCLQMHMRVI
jgi:hypothetical protein